MTIRLLSENRCHGGCWQRFQHSSHVLQCDMTFSIYRVEKRAEAARSNSALLWLSGLTCTDQNFVQKAHAERAANELGLTLLVPDTSPRGIIDFPGLGDSYDLGLGAGFYLDATQEPWRRHFKMESYLIHEFLPLVVSECSISGSHLGISGHSMGGHGALTLALKYPDLFRSVSALAPIAAPMQCPWGRKAFTAYLGADQSVWRQYDSCALIEEGARIPGLLVDQGKADEFLASQLLPDKLAEVCDSAGITLDLNFHEGYDHSYFFISTFIDKHLRYHSQALVGSV